jgi:hypothetical protein
MESRRDGQGCDENMIDIPIQTANFGCLARQGAQLVRQRALAEPLL